MDLLKSIICYSFLILCLNANAQFKYPQVLFQGGKEIPQLTDVITMDIDVDGDLDVISASETDTRIMLFENDGSGNFETKNVISSHTQVGKMASTDVNNDGYPDLVVIVPKPISKIVWFENLQNGTFSLPLILLELETTSYIYDAIVLKVADLNNDNLEDIIFQNDNEIKWLQKIGPLNYDSPKIIANSLAFEILIEDLNNDGYLDLFYNSNYSINNQGTSFSDGDLDSTTNFQAIGILDVNNDGKKDLLGTSQIYISGEGHYEINVLLNRDSISFDSTYVLMNYQSSPNNDFILEDIDNDGDADLINENHEWFRNDNGEFSFVSKFSDAPFTCYSLLSADLNGDNKKDIITGRLFSIYWYNALDIANDLSLNVPSQKIIEDIPQPSIGYRLQFYNRDNSEFDDIISVYNSDGQNYFLTLLNDGNSFNPILDTTNLINLHWAREFQMADINNDNHDDFFQVDENESVILMLKNNGNNQFLTVDTIQKDSLDPRIYNIKAVEDIDQDGYMDIVYNSYYYIYIAYSDQNNNFNIVKLNNEYLLGNSHLNNYDLADLNGDGLKDIVQQTSTKFIIYGNLGNQTFGPAGFIEQPKRLNLFPYEYEMTIGDLDGDGDDEIITSLDYKKTISCDPFWGCEYEYAYVTAILDYNSSINNLQQVKIYEEKLFLEPSFILDFNNDSKGDVLSRSQDQGLVIRYIDSIELFTPQETLIEGSLLNLNMYNSSIYFNDFDKDQDIDVFIIHYDDLSSFYNSNFQRIELFESELNTDIDNDGFTTVLDCDDLNASIGDTLPNPSLNNNIFEVCLGDSISITTSINSPIQYNWSGPLGFTSNETTISTSSITALSAGQYSLHFSTENCLSDTVFFEIIVNDTPTIELVLEENILITNGHNNLNYNWYLNDAIIQNENQSTYTPISDGFYYAEAINEDGCSGQSNNIQVLLTSLNDLQSSLISIYPNPTKDVIKTNILISEDAIYQIWSVQGKLVSNGKLKREISVKGFDDGTYLLYIMSNKTSFLGKFQVIN